MKKINRKNLKQLITYWKFEKRLPMLYVFNPDKLVTISETIEALEYLLKTKED